MKKTNRFGNAPPARWLVGLTFGLIVTLGLAWPGTSQAGLIGYWIYDDYAGGGTVADLSGNGNDATLTGTIATTPVVAGPAAVPAMKAIDMDYGGVSGSITVASDPTLNFAANDFTIAMWLEDRAADYARYFKTDAWELQGTNFGDSDAMYLRPPTWSTTSTFNGQYKGSWHHIALTGDGTTVRWYLDGAELDTTAQSSFTGTWNTLELGTNTTRIDGLLGDVAIFNTTETDILGIRNRTHPEIAAAFAAAVPEPSALILSGIGLLGLLAYRRGRMYRRE